MNLKTFKSGIWVKDLETFLKVNLLIILKSATQDVGLAISQGLKNFQILFKEIAVKINVLKEEVRKRLDPEINRLIEAIKQIDLDALKKKIGIQIDALNNKIRPLLVDIQRTFLTYDWSQLKWVVLSVVILCSIDSLLNYNSLLILAKNLLSAILLSIAVAAGLSYSAHIISEKIHQAPTEFMKRAWFIIALVGGGIVFLFLGFLRQKYTGDTSFVGSPLLWMTFNLFFYMIALLIAILRLPTKEQRIEYKELQSKKKHVKKFEKEKASLDKGLEKETLKRNELKLRLELFRKYREELLLFLDKEKNRIDIAVQKEIEIKGGNSKLVKQ